MRTAVKIPIAAEQYPDAVVIHERGKYRSVKATSVERGVVLANARNAADAKRRFAECVEQIVDQLQDPKIVFHRGYVGVIYLHVSNGSEEVNWAHKIICPDGRPGGNSITSTLDHAERSCRNHITQYVTDYADDASVIGSWEFLLPDQRDDFLRYTSWQRARADADRGAVEMDPNEWAGRHQIDYLPALKQLIADHEAAA